MKGSNFIMIKMLSLAMIDSGSFRSFSEGLKKHKLYILIKREIHILITTRIKKICKYIKFTVAFYGFSYFEIGA